MEILNSLSYVDVQEAQSSSVCTGAPTVRSTQHSVSNLALKTWHADSDFVRVSVRCEID